MCQQNGTDFKYQNGSDILNFSNIIGNDDIKELLSKSLETKNLVHSYMFIGSDGIGKSLFAKELAKMILCETAEKACGNCSSCIKFDSGNHPDFAFIDSEDGKSIKIGQIRLMQESIAEKPIVSSNKVYVINNSDLMTTEAQNCLLKTLEEPPEYANLILVASNESKLLNTIKSRCTKISFKKLTDDDLKKYAETHSININFNLLPVYDGSIAKLIALSTESDLYDSLDKIIDSLENKNIIDIWNDSEILYKSKENIANMLDYFNIVFLNKLRTTNDYKYVNAVKFVEISKKKLSSNANYDMCIDNLLLQLWKFNH